MSASTRAQKWLITLLLFCSGATALVYEVVWNRWLGSVLGNSGQAHAVVLAAFLGGVALGAWVFGRRADSHPRPLSLYAWLELGVAGWALGFPAVLAALQAAYVALAAPLPEAARVAPRLALAAAAVFPPALLMGGTLVPVVRHFTGHLGGLRDGLARLYAVNALGAAAGALAGGMVLLPRLGLTGATRAAAGVNLAVALVAWAVARARRPGTGAERGPLDGAGAAPKQPAGGAAAAEPLESAGAAPKQPAGGAAEAPEPEYGPGAVRAARLGAAGAGFSAMALQLCWIRVLTLAFGGSTYAFTTTVATVILGIGAGSLLVPRLKERDSLRAFGFAQLFAAAAVAAGVPLYERLPVWGWQLAAGLGRTEAQWPAYQAGCFLLGASVLLVPAALLGAAFPLAARAGTTSAAELGRGLGSAYLWNTLGTLTGALLTGLWLMPLLSLERCVALAIAASLGAAALALRAAAPRPQARWPTLAVAAACAGVIALALFSGAGWSSVLANAGTFREAGPPPSDFGRWKAALLAADLPLFQRDDSAATVAVGQNVQSGELFLRINGKVDASDGEDMSTQLLLGHLGALLHHGPLRRALVIGLGSGVTVGALLTHGVEYLDVVEISPAVVEAAGLFADANRGALFDPRVHLHVDDARTFLLLERGKYDVIVSEPSNPWLAGVASLYTREFFELARERLAPGGRLVQWQHLYETDEALVRLVLRTLRAVFPHGTSWSGGLDLLMVASDDAQAVDHDALVERLGTWAVGPDLGRIRAHTAPALLSLQVHGDESQKELAGDGPLITQDHNLLEFQAPIAFFALRQRVPLRDDRLDPDRAKALFLHGWEEKRPLSAEDAAGIHSARLFASQLDDPAVEQAARRWLALAPDGPGPQDAVASSALALGRTEEAVGRFTALVASGYRAPATVARWAEAVAKWEGERGAPWSGAPAVLPLLAEALEAAPELTELQKPLAHFCRGAPLEKCLGDARPSGQPER